MTMKTLNKAAKKAALNVIDHPLAQDKLTQLRDKDTSPEHFRRLVMELSQLLTYEATKHLKTKSVKVETPLQKTTGLRVSEPVTFVPIMRAGLAMLEGALRVMPNASSGHIGIYRDKLVNHTIEYYFRLPKDVEKSRVFVFDPMLATGDTMVAALSRLKEYKVGPIAILNILVSKAGYERVAQEHPDVEIFTLSLEPILDKNGYILPGVGDAGDRIYGTEDIL
jgi:uracil phosphoribosyltransferase